MQADKKDRKKDRNLKPQKGRKTERGGCVGVCVGGRGWTNTKEWAETEE